jgi:prolipoprotein diacylglyceryltransferase
MISSGVNPLTNPADLLIIRGGVATGPAATGAILTAAWLGRRELLPVLDGLAAASLAGLAGWHAGCLVRDACLGTPSNLPWAVAQPGSNITRHPVELYAALLLGLAAFVIGWWRAKARPLPGMPAALALMVSGFARLATEPMRPNLDGGPIGWYIAAIVLGGGTAIWLVQHRRKVRTVGNSRVR